MAISKWVCGWAIQQGMMQNDGEVDRATAVSVTETGIFAVKI